MRKLLRCSLDIDGRLRGADECFEIENENQIQQIIRDYAEFHCVSEYEVDISVWEEEE